MNYGGNFYEEISGFYLINLEKNIKNLKMLKKSNILRNSYQKIQKNFEIYAEKNLNILRNSC